jgi:hypothetical protein
MWNKVIRNVNREKTGWSPYAWEQDGGWERLGQLEAQGQICLPPQPASVALLCCCWLESLWEVRNAGLAHAAPPSQRPEDGAIEPAFLGSNSGSDPDWLCELGKLLNLPVPLSPCLLSEYLLIPWKHKSESESSDSAWPW